MEGDFSIEQIYDEPARNVFKLFKHINGPSGSNILWPLQRAEIISCLRENGEVNLKCTGEDFYLKGFTKLL